MSRFRSLVHALAAVAALLPWAGASTAQDYPSRPIRIIVPYPPGSGTDIVGRLLGQKLSESLGQQVFVDNRPGAGATIGTDAVAKADPDGYTLLMADVGPLAISPTFYPKLPYIPAKDFRPISQVAVLPFALVMHPSVQATTVPELVSLAKAKKGELNYASVGNGTAVHLATELFRSLSGIDVVHVPYRGSAPALTDLVAGRVSLMFVNVLSAMPFVESGQLRALALGMAQRSPAFPSLPTFAEFGMPNFRAGVWFGLLAPAATPPAVVEKLNREVVRALQSHELKEKLAQRGADVTTSTPDEFHAHIQDETARWAEVIKNSGIKAD